MGYKEEREEVFSAYLNGKISYIEYILELSELQQHQAWRIQGDILGSMVGE